MDERTLPGALLVILTGSTVFTFGTLGARVRLPGSRALQAVGVAAIMLGMLAIVVRWDS